MNIHHLELFYYVARHGGIMEAVRHIPYGIQQPAVSGQVAQLEEQLGVTLFRRRPFALTPPGERLFKQIQPFFSSLDSLAGELQGGKSRQIRIGAATIILRDHLPQLFLAIRKRFPDLKIFLREGYQIELEALLQREDLDLAVTLIEKKSAPGIHSMSLIELPLVLLVPTASTIKDAAELWERDRIEETLICLPEHELMCRNFQQGLIKAGVDWYPGMEVSSIDLVETYVANGFGIGLSIYVPLAKEKPGIRVLPLAGFAPVPLGALWRGKPSPLLQVFLDEMQARARRLTQGAS
jgi:DNA-binding transcriptional LysR family regulator